MNRQPHMQSPCGEPGTAEPPQGRKLGLIAALPGAGASLLPVGVCPACWPAYAGVLSALGLSFLFDEAWLLPLTAAFLLVAVASLAYRAGSRRGYRPFFVGVLAAALLLVGKFLFASDLASYGGAALLVAAVIWNAWPRSIAETNAAACPACAPDGPSPHPEIFRECEETLK